jgi:succinate dehydrogenase / fumarate reductase membrane anchor subunit
MSWRAQGMRTWILQRLTALFMLIYMLVYAVIIVRHPIGDFAAWRGLFASPLSNIATEVFFFSLLFHAWVGVRDILIDYVPISGLRLVLWTLVTLCIIAIGLWGSMILLSVVRL